VRLQVPPPLDTPMEVRLRDAGVEMAQGETVIATARATQVELEVPPAPRYADAEAASPSYVGFRSHPYPGCFVCGPLRSQGDGLRIFPGKVPGTGVVASPWVPDASLGDERGRVRPEFMWSALDCPGAFATGFADDAPMLLGELAAALKGRIAVGERCIAIGWELARDGRRHYVGTALFTETGECRGYARATWFEVTPNR
jgi:hypothetical protein